MNKKVFGVLVVVIITIFSFTGCEVKYEDSISNTQNTNNSSSEDTLGSTMDINLKDIDGTKTNYSFTYKNQKFLAKYTKDNWHIEDSYKIDNAEDIKIICQALIEVHPIHGKDLKSYRTVDDLVYEWQQHNLAYNLLPEDNLWKKSAKDVDLNPEDQGKNLAEIYEDRTGKKLDL